MSPIHTPSQYRTRPLQRSRATLLLVPALLLAACAQVPVGPSVAVMPAANKPFEVFVQEDQSCRAWAAQSIGPQDAAQANQPLLASAVAGALIGAVAGAAIGDHRSAGAGAAIGTAVGASAGAGQNAGNSMSAQRRYDIAYQQCMYAKGNSVPTGGGYGYGYRAYPGPAPMMQAPMMPPPPGPAP